MSLPLQAQVQAKLTGRYRLLLEALRNHPGLGNCSYKLFAPRTGRFYDREFMLVGRALYGWATAELSKGWLSQHGVDQAVEDSWKYLDPGDCPLAALIDEWERLRAAGASRYNPRKSQFWMTARGVMGGLFVVAVHPARKPRGLITASVLEHFDALESSAALTSAHQQVVKFAGATG